MKVEPVFLLSSMGYSCQQVELMGQGLFLLVWKGRGCRLSVEEQVCPS
jgi:hypothetical protein